MQADLNKVLDRVGESEVVTEDVALTDVRYRGVAPFHAPVKLEAVAANRAGIVTLDCTYRYTLSLVCDRCLKPFEKQVTQRESHVVVRALENGAEDDEYLVAPTGFVDLISVATNDILVNLPGKYLCREDCKGLCPVCGCDRNEHDCGCRESKTDPRLEALNKFYE